MNHSITSPKKTTKSKLSLKTKINKRSKQTVLKILLFCGILSSLYYVAINIFVPMQYEGYNSVSQTISELSAIGAPTRPLWVLLVSFYSLLVIAFGLAVWESAIGNRPLRNVAVLLLVYGVSGFFWPPMHQREVLAAGGSTFADTMHIVFTIVTVILMLLAIGFGASAFGRKFRIYSTGTIVGLLVFGVLTGIDAPNISTNQSTPWIGIWERINIGIFLLWVIMLAIVLLKREEVSETE